jgi:hypothetical protein
MQHTNKPTMCTKAHRYTHRQTHLETPTGRQIPTALQSLTNKQRHTSHTNTQRHKDTHTHTHTHTHTQTRQPSPLSHGQRTRQKKSVVMIEPSTQTGEAFGLCAHRKGEVANARQTLLLQRRGNVSKGLLWGPLDVLHKPACCCGGLQNKNKKEERTYRTHGVCAFQSKRNIRDTNAHVDDNRVLAQPQQHSELTTKRKTNMNTSKRKREFESSRERESSREGEFESSRVREFESSRVREREFERESSRGKEAKR